MVINHLLTGMILQVTTDGIHTSNGGVCNDFLLFFTSNIWAMKKGLLVWGIDGIGIILPIYVGIIVSHYTDPRSLWNNMYNGKQVVFFVASFGEMIHFDESVSSGWFFSNLAMSGITLAMLVEVIRISHNHIGCFPKKQSEMCLVGKSLYQVIQSDLLIA